MLEQKLNCGQPFFQIHAIGLEGERMWRQLINERPSTILGENLQVERVGHSGEINLYSRTEHLDHSL